MTFKQHFSLWYAKGYVQKSLTLLVFIVLTVVLAYTIERLCYGHILAGVDVAVANYVPSNEIPVVKRTIYAQTKDFGVSLIVPIFAGILFLFLLVRVSTWLNITKSVTLDKAVRFGDAMERLGLLKEADQVNFIRSHKLPLYIANAPLASAEEEKVGAKPYVFAYNMFFFKRVPGCSIRAEAIVCASR